MNQLEFPPKKQGQEIIDQQLINNFIKDLKEYDDQHSTGSWASFAIAGTMMSAIKDEEGIEKLQEKIKNNLTPDEIYKRHYKTLKNLGIDIESQNKKGNIDENESYAVGEININLVNKDLYLKYLKSLEKDKIEDSTVELLKMISSKFSRQVQEEYSLEDADVRLLELISGLKEISIEYERLGLKEEISDLKEYQEYLNTGYLKEYISAKNHKIFEPIGEGFNLSTFQRDSTKERYIKYWNLNFFSELEKIKKNPKALDFYNKVLEYGKNCIAFAEKDLEKLKEKYGIGNIDYVFNMEDAIEETRAKLKALK